MSKKAVSLISGGLDSLLATKLILEQGIEVVGINFFTGFSGDHDYCFRKSENGKHGAQWVADKLGIKLHIMDVTSEFKQVLLNPKYGYGANINPCLDCKLFMIMQAKKWMEEHGYDFLITGEVIGQRPMSQRKDTLPIATKVTSDLIVRPLSAKLLEPTLPERESWIDREKLGDISGRSRQKQFALAKRFGFVEFPQPAGGCPLTDAAFCKRLQDLLDHRENGDYSKDDVLLLYVGRHLRIKSNPSLRGTATASAASAKQDEAIQECSGLPCSKAPRNDGEGLKLIVGRNEVENKFIENYLGKNVLLNATSHPGALVFLDGELKEDDLEFAAKIAAYFSKGRNDKEIKVLARFPNGKEEELVVDPLENPELLQDWYI